MATEKSFIKGALILTTAGILAKMLGALYRIPFNRIVGEEGAALYGLSYSLYLILFALSTAGIPLAVSKLVAESEEKGNFEDSKYLLRVTLAFMGIIGFFAFISVFFGANWISMNLFHDERVALSLKFLAPAMFFSCLTSVFRGYFQGKQMMLPTAISQVLEQSFRVLFIFLSLMILAEKSLETIVAGATFASVVGGILSVSFLILYYFRYNKKTEQALQTIEKKNPKVIIFSLLSLTIPICIGALVLPLMQFIDTTLIIPRLLSIGYNKTEALIHQGYLTSYAMPLISLPFIITTSISTSLVPAISENNEKANKSAIIKDSQMAILLTIIIMLPAATGLAILGKPIIWLIFNHELAGYALTYVSFTVLGVGLYQVSSGILQGLGKAYLPMISLFLGLILKFILTYFLTGIAILGVKGAALATVIAYFTAMLTNLVFLTKEITFAWFIFKRHILKPFISVVVMGISVYFSYFFMLGKIGNTLSTFSSIVLGGLIYFIVLFFIGGIEKEVIEKLPKVGLKLSKMIK